MALSDWTKRAIGSAASLSGAQVNSGSSSLKIDGTASVPSVMTWDGANADQPSYGQLDTWVYEKGFYSNSGFAFRVQDASNFYVVYSRNAMENHTDWKLGKWVNGSFTQIDTKAVEATTSGSGVWFGLRYKTWNVSGGIEAKVQIDTGTGFQSAHSDYLSDPSPDGALPDGGIGIATKVQTDGDQTGYYLDDTAVYY